MSALGKKKKKNDEEATALRSSTTKPLFSNLFHFLIVVVDVVLRAAALRPQLASRSRVSWRILLLSTALTFSQKSVFYYYSTQQKRFSLLSMHVQAKVGSSWTF